MKKYSVLFLALFFVLACGGGEKAQWNKAKATLKDMNVLATAIVDYITENGIAPSQDGVIRESGVFYNAISPKYLKVIPMNDQWGERFRIYCGSACDGKYGTSNSQPHDFLIVSYARDKLPESSWEYDAADPKNGLFTVYNEEDFNKDLILYNGSIIRSPFYHTK